MKINTHLIELKRAFKAKEQFFELFMSGNKTILLFILLEIFVFAYKIKSI